MDQFSAALPEGLGIRKIHHVAVIVRDMEASLGLYRDKMGLDVDAIAPQVEGKFMSAFVRAVKPSRKQEACCGP